jgi:hypothetical protein
VTVWNPSYLASRCKGICEEAYFFIFYFHTNIAINR